MDKNTNIKIDNRDVLLEMNHLRKILDNFMRPDVLDKIVELQEELGDNNSLLERYDWFLQNSEFKEDCAYAKMSKNLFLVEHGDNMINLIKWLYNNFAKDL
jgi:hypothetical protein